MSDTWLAAFAIIFENSASLLIHFRNLCRHSSGRSHPDGVLGVDGLNVPDHGYGNIDCILCIGSNTRNMVQV